MSKGLLLINLGSPDAATTSAVRRYLRQFLMDRHVIDNHWIVRAMLVHGIIAPLRAPKSAHAYQSVWRDDGSPLIHFSRRFAMEVAKNTDVKVELAMRYGQPSVRSAVVKLKAAGVNDLKVVPLYPQFAKSSSLTAMEEVSKEIRRHRWNARVKFLQDFYDQPEWIGNLAEKIHTEQTAFRADHLLMSYHGLPQHHVQQFDRSGTYCLKQSNCCDQIATVNRWCYRAQCFATSRALVRALEWPVQKLSISFQSRLGRRPWIRPYSDQVIVELARAGVRRLLVTCPSFVADCLETLEEVAIRLRRDFIAAGGEDLRLVTALNDSSHWAQDFVQMIARDDLSWIDSATSQTLIPGLEAHQ